MGVLRLKVRERAVMGAAELLLQEELLSIGQVILWGRQKARSR